MLQVEIQEKIVLAIIGGDLFFLCLMPIELICFPANFFQSMYEILTCQYLYMPTFLEEVYSKANLNAV
jgi:hypothetical protein